MNKFWTFRNIGETAGELLLYGDIRSEKPWWSEGNDAIYPRQFNDDLKELGNISELTVRINSMGGDVFAAISIYTALKSHAANVTVRIEGVAASAATIVAMAADSIEAPSNALFMIHDPLLVLYGMYNADDMKKMADVLDTVKESIINSYVNKTGRDRQELSDMMNEESWMTAEEAKAEGFIDQILFEDESLDASVTNDGRFMIVNSVTHDLSKFNTRPSIKNRAAAAPPAIQVTARSTSSPINHTQEREITLDIKNIEDLKRHFPDLCNQLENSAAANERERMKAIDSISATISSELINKAKYETPMNAQELAFQALKNDAGKATKFLNQREAELEDGEEVAAAAPPDDKEIKDAAVIDRVANAANANRRRYEEGRR